MPSSEECGEREVESVKDIFCSRCAQTGRLDWLAMLCSLLYKMTDIEHAIQIGTTALPSVFIPRRLSRWVMNHSLT